MAKPAISVVIPVYNQEKYIEETLQSVLSQEGVDFEVVAVNDGSMDRSGEILKKLADRIRIIDQENQGEGMARNKAIKNAQGDLIALLDSDDRYLPGHLMHAVEFARNHPEVIVFYGDAWLIDQSGNKLWVQKSVPEISFENLIVKNGLINSTAIVRRTLFDEGEWYRVRPVGADWDLWLRAAEKGGQFCHYPWIGVEYRKHPESAIQQKQLEAEKWGFNTLEWVFSRHPELDKNLKRQALAMVYYESMVRFLAAGEGKNARARALACLRRDPLMFKAWLGLMLSTAPNSMIKKTISIRRQILKWLV